MGRLRLRSWLKWVGLGMAAVVLMFFGLIAAVLVFATMAQAIQAKAKPADSLIIESNVTYKQVDNRSLLLDLARPKQGDGPFPGVLFIHGGGWRGGDRKEYLQAVYSLAQHGYVAATVQYRFAPADHFPAQLDDVRAAIRYLRSRAKELKLDPKRIGVVGGSAGGHLALLLGTVEPRELEPVGKHLEFSNRVQAVVSFAGPTELTQPFPPLVETMVTDLIGKSRRDAPDAYRRASPINYLSANDPPILTIHGTADELVPYEQTTALIAACKKVGVETELITIKGGGHGADAKTSADWVAAVIAMVKFLDKHLKPEAIPTPSTKP